MTKYTDLERLALDAHRNGWSWTQFCRANGEAMRRAEPVNTRAYHRLADHLLALVVSGNADGHHPIDPDAESPWERDDGLGQVSDTHTAARFRGVLFDNSPPYE
ncbi:MAG: hypothetical protein NTW96_06480 [Planctomycetia bacterium]|nr:hypothetical protein [Planctomycetia bacterium]